MDTDTTTTTTVPSPTPTDQTPIPTSSVVADRSTTPHNNNNNNNNNNKCQVVDALRDLQSRVQAVLQTMRAEDCPIVSGPPSTASTTESTTTTSRSEFTGNQQRLDRFFFHGCYLVNNRRVAVPDARLRDTRTVEDRLVWAAQQGRGRFVALYEDGVTVRETPDDLIRERTSATAQQPTASGLACRRRDRDGRPLGYDGVALYEVPEDAYERLRRSEFTTAYGRVVVHGCFRAPEVRIDTTTTTTASTTTATVEARLVEAAQQGRGRFVALGGSGGALAAVRPTAEEIFVNGGDALNGIGARASANAAGCQLRDVNGRALGDADTVVLYELPGETYARMSRTEYTTSFGPVVFHGCFRASQQRYYHPDTTQPRDATVEQRLVWAARQNRGRFVALNNDLVTVRRSTGELIGDMVGASARSVNGCRQRRDADGRELGTDAIALYEIPADTYDAMQQQLQQRRR